MEFDECASIHSWCESVSMGRWVWDVTIREIEKQAAVAERLACSPPTKASRVQSPAGPLPDFRKWESCRTMPLVGKFSRRSPVSPAPSFRCRSIFTSITLIGSQDLDVKFRQNLFTSLFLGLVYPSSSVARRDRIRADGLLFSVKAMLHDTRFHKSLCKVRHRGRYTGQYGTRHGICCLLRTYFTTRLLMNEWASLPSEVLQQRFAPHVVHIAALVQQRAGGVLIAASPLHAGDRPQMKFNTLHMCDTSAPWQRKIPVVELKTSIVPNRVEKKNRWQMKMAAALPAPRPRRLCRPLGVRDKHRAGSPSFLRNVRLEGILITVRPVTNRGAQVAPPAASRRATAHAPPAILTALRSVQAVKALARAAGSRPGISDAADLQFACRTGNLSTSPSQLSSTTTTTTQQQQQQTQRQKKRGVCVASKEWITGRLVFDVAVQMSCSRGGCRRQHDTPVAPSNCCGLRLTQLACWAASLCHAFPTSCRQILTCQQRRPPPCTRHLKALLADSWLVTKFKLRRKKLIGVANLMILPPELTFFQKKLATLADACGGKEAFSLLNDASMRVEISGKDKWRYFRGAKPAFWPFVVSRFGPLLTSRPSEPMRVIEVNMEQRRNEGAGEYSKSRTHRDSCERGEYRRSCQIDPLSHSYSISVTPSLNSATVESVLMSAVPTRWDGQHGGHPTATNAGNSRVTGSPLAELEHVGEPRSGL
ncbi:hypothetical protein PR048_030515 [Dryococelus australis]|uniref:DNA-directed RNA polymerase n=1 Tax=Dryococelus australis TaxID=614101 RepID=A0ABQ9G980_9NEOP|nr:hypothetical protein PR048_030515 [Dryococelus australis]